MIKFSFIIPVKEINGFIREAILKILVIKRDDFEIIIYPDNINSEQWGKTRQIASGPGGPAMKRSLAINDARGEILIFIDDDAYPGEDFLDKLDRDFSDTAVAAVGGPAVTPENDSFWQKVSGAVYLSSLSGGYPERYASVGKKKYIDDWPSVNLSVRKDVFTKIKGFDSKYWPGEDTRLCLDIINKTGNKILYDPDLIVFHHRRQGFIRHLKQAGRYGLHRGFFAKKYPQTSLRIAYFIPSLFLLFIIFGASGAFFSDIIAKLYLLGWGLYFLALIRVYFDLRKYEKNILVILSSIYYAFFTHIVYGFRFIQGFVFTKDLKSKLR